MWLWALAVADASAGLAGVHSRYSRAAVGCVLGWLAALAVGASSAAAWSNLWPSFIAVALGLVAWLALKTSAVQSSAAKPDRTAAVAVAVLAIATVSVIALSDSGATFQPVSSVLAGADLPARLTADPRGMVILCGVLVWLTSSANALVRMLLKAAHSNVETGEANLRGGRLIGALERLLVFGMALAGEPGAGAIVITAKGLLRFPELRRGVNDADAHQVSEYLLLGSLASLAAGLTWVPLLS